ncbi:MAG: TonB-dependent receptor [Flavobacteriaceae bacterium]|nr:TonB-dependent receptor [Flavobacteriaceae bacterium]
MSKLFTSLSIVLLLSILSITSQTIQQDTTKVRLLDEVVITAQYQPQSEKNAIYKVKSIKSDIINKKAASNLRELLLQEANIELEQNSVFGSSIELQGVSKENIKILIDGVPVIGRLNGIIDLNQIDLATIERVEIIEGPVSVFYGTDAMGGVVNLITKKSQKDKVEGKLSALYESIDATKLNGSVGFKFGKNTIKLNGSKYHFNGLSTNENAVRNLNWEERKQQFGGVQYIRAINSLKLRYSTTYANEKLFSVGDADRRGKIYDKDYFTRRINNNLSLQGKILENKFLNISASYLDYQRYHDTYNVDPTTFSKTKSTTDTKDNNIVKFNFTGLKAQLGKGKSSEKLSYAFGTDYNVENTEGSRILNKKQGITTLAVFGSVNYQLTDNFELQPALRQTWNSTYGSLLSPAINSKLKFNNENTLRFSYARGFRAPSLKELFLDFHMSLGPITYIISGNENLEVEKSHNFNLVYTFQRSVNEVSYFKVEPSFFYNNISNLIALSDLVNFKRNYINIDQFKSVGGKLLFEYKPFSSLKLNSGIAVTGRYNKFTVTSNTDEFLYATDVLSSVNYSFNNLGLDVDMFYKFTGEREGFVFDSSANNVFKTKRDSFHNLDMTLSKSFFKKSLQASVGVKNLFDVKDIETINEIGTAHSRDMQLWGRSLFIRTSYSF